MNKKLFHLILLFVAFSMFIGGLYAVYRLTLPANYTAVELGLSANPSTVEFNDVVVGESGTKIVNLTNDGTKAFVSLNMTHDLPVTQGTLTWNIEGSSLAIGANIDATFILTLEATATLGSGTIQISIGE